MNNGERDELLAILSLLKVKQNMGEFDSQQVQSIKSGLTECNINSSVNFNTILSTSDSQLSLIAKSCGISKAPSGAKADVQINGIGYSIKSVRSAPPAIVNHTARPGFQKVCDRVRSDIKQLDRIIDDYWLLRSKGEISEDTKIVDVNCPFKIHKEFMRPILNYFLFTGTGQKDSLYPAKKIISIDNPLDVSSWRLYDEKNALDLFWDKMVFSLRAKKGMPSGYPDNMSPKALTTKTSLERWTKFIDGDYRGALHIRTTR